MSNFKWQASESAPKNFPMQVVSGFFSSPDDDVSYIPNKATLYSGWGRGRSSHIVGDDFKSLPNNIDITFFSYIENQFYSEKFKLPYDKILSLFKNGYYSPKEEAQITYDRIIAGIAPGGIVSVWLSGVDKTTVVFLNSAKKSNIDWRNINNNADYTREKYVKLTLEESIAPNKSYTIASQGIPFDHWKTYHTRYYWRPQLSHLKILDNLISRINYFNGENSYLFIPQNHNKTYETLAIPSDLHFVWQRNKFPALLIELYFNETEIISVFKALSHNFSEIILDIRLQTLSNGKQQMTTWLMNNKKEIKLALTDIKAYAA